MYKFGRNSMKKLKTCHPDIVKVMLEAIRRSDVDFGISEGHRSLDRQLELYKEGKSTVKLGKHNTIPSEAVDIYAYHPDIRVRKRLAYDLSHLSYIAGVIASVAKEMLLKGLISHKFRWGANWDSDGVIRFDQNFQDYPHHEIVKA